VSIFCDNFSQFETEQEFDVVLAIGVLEYTPIYYGGADAIDCFLSKAYRMLKGSGTLILGIENQLGLKYFSGCGEDHVGKVFYGIQDLYDKANGPVTLGREELVQKLLRAQFSTAKFFYPFPDYKLPTVLLSEEGVRDRELDAGRIIAEFPARDYLNRRESFFSEQAVWPVFHRNLLVENLSNSFLVFASGQYPSRLLESVDWLAKIFTSYRLKRFRTVTTIKRIGSVIKVCKERLHPELPLESSPLVRLRVPGVTDFHKGETMAHVLTRKLLHPATTFSNFVDLLKPWAHFLRKNISPDQGPDSERIVPGEFLDCTPRNLIHSASNPSSLIYFDAEWEYLRPLPLLLPLFRGLLHLRVQCVNNGIFENLPLKYIMPKVFRELGFAFSDTDLATMTEHEADFQCLITPWRREDWLEETRNVLSNPFPVPDSLWTVLNQRDCLRVKLAQCHSDLAQRHSVLVQCQSDLAQCRSELDQCRSELGRMAESTSWRWTAPLREIWNLMAR